MFGDSNWLKWLLIGAMIWMVITSIKWPLWMIFWIAPLLIGPITWHGETEKRKTGDQNYKGKTGDQDGNKKKEYRNTADGTRLEIVEAPAVRSISMDQRS